MTRWTAPTPSSRPSSAPSAPAGEGWTSAPSASRDRNEAVDTGSRNLYLARPSQRSGEERWAAHRAGEVMGRQSLPFGGGCGGSVTEVPQSNHWVDRVYLRR